MIKLLDVDGVPTLLAPTTGPMHAGLVFRVGQADETLARRGITHLIEHLALHAFGPADHHYNGATGTEHTFFHTQGSPETITGFLGGVCAGLRSLPMARLDVERDILRTEESGGPGYSLWRHGARDFGLLSYPEWGLHALRPDDLHAWVAHWFTRENAALWIAGDEIPRGLRLDLPAGVRRPPPAASSALPVTPAYFGGPSGMVGWQAPVRRGAPSAVFASVLERRMFAELRHQLGLSYTVSCEYGTHGFGAEVVARADSLPEKQGAVLGGLVDLLAALRAGRIGHDEITSVTTRSGQALIEADERGARLPGQTFNLLGGRPVVDRDDELAELRAVTRDDVVRVAAEAHAAGLLMTPGGAAADWAGYTAAPTSSPTAVDGVRHRVPHVAGQALVTGPSGVTSIDGDTLSTVRFDALAAMLAWPDGGRRLIGHDGMVVTVEPTYYRNVASALPDLDARVPPHLRIDLPARDPDRLPRPPELSLRTRWHIATARWRTPRTAKLRLLLPSAAGAALLLGIATAAVLLGFGGHISDTTMISTAVVAMLSGGRCLRQFFKIQRALKT